jgi:acyl-CoA reductase-like NAD-dependent aldehyde dehydrogenase
MHDRAMRSSEPGDMDRAVAVLTDAKDRWARVPIPERIALARQCIDRCVDTARDVVAACCRAKGLDVDDPASAEEWLAGPVPIIRNLRLLIETLADIRRDGHPRLNRGAPAPHGEVVVSVLPRDRFDRLLYPGVRIDVWLQPEVTPATMLDTIAVAYRSATRHAGRVALVLGAGNVSSIGPMDVVYKLFVENRVVVLKMHPINAYLGPLIDRAFQPLVDAGCLRIVYGDAAEGQYLVHHPGVDEIHITGSAVVHDRIVWGDTPAEQARRRASATPKVAKRITSELGCVTPVIVVPGDWSDTEIAYQAENVATMVAHNASCNCNAAKLVVTWTGWRARRRFVDTIESILAALPQRKAYYPESARKHAAFLAGRADVRGAAAGAGTLPYAMIADVDPARVDDVVFREEAWSPILAETALPADDAGAFLHTAVRFCNERLAGTLSAMLIVDPRARAHLGPSVDRAIASLRYGTVAINHWSAMAYALAVPPWGAYPGHTLADIGSGIGAVHNTMMFDRPEKSVLWGPFTTSPKPVWFCTHRRAHVAARQMVPFEASPSLWRVPRLAIAAYRPGVP